MQINQENQQATNLIISIVNHNSRDSLRVCIRSILDTVYQTDFRICAVNNTPADGCEAMLETEFPQVKFWSNQTPEGFATNHNKVLTQEQGHYYLVLNPDVVMQEDTVDTLVRFMETHSDAGMVGPQILKSNLAPEPPKLVRKPIVEMIYCMTYISNIDITPLIVAMKKFIRKLKAHATDENTSPGIQTSGSEFYKTDFLSGSCFMIRREVIDQVGLMDERFFLYFEENDWQKRTQEAGWTLNWLPGVSVIHVGGQSTHTSSVEYLKYLRIYIDSAILFYGKHHGFLINFLFRAILVSMTLINLLRWPFIYLLIPKRRDEASAFFHFSYHLLPLLVFGHDTEDRHKSRPKNRHTI